MTMKKYVISVRWCLALSSAPFLSIGILGGELFYLLERTGTMIIKLIPISLGI